MFKLVPQREIERERERLRRMTQGRVGGKWELELETENCNCGKRSHSPEEVSQGLLVLCLFFTLEVFASGDSALSSDL
jgi:hypothetical protein